MAGDKEIVEYDDLNSKFVEELRELVGDDILACFQCGTCTAGCPSAPFGFNIRQILKLARWGFKNSLLDSDFIWFCTECGKCAERCAKNIKPYKIILGLQNLAAKRGNLPLAHRLRLEAFIEKGCIVERDELTTMKRERLVLPECEEELPVKVKEELEAILNETEFRKSFQEQMESKEEGGQMESE